MSENNTPELTVATREATLQPAQEPSIGGLLQQLIAAGITSDNVTALEKLCDLKFKTEDRDAGREFARDFAAMQSEMPDIKATKPVPNKDGTLRYRFAPYEEIMDSVQPLLRRYGFAVSYSSSWDAPRVTMTCILTHRGGHTRENSFAVRVGQGPPGASDSQCDGAAMTYAKRGALCNALNIVVDHDDDGRVQGDPTPITASQAADLRAKCEDVGADKKRFLEFAGAATFEQVQADKLDSLLKELERKARK